MISRYSHNTPNSQLAGETQSEKSNPPVISPLDIKAGATNAVSIMLEAFSGVNPAGATNAINAVNGRVNTFIEIMTRAAEAETEKYVISYGKRGEINSVDAKWLAQKAPQFFKETDKAGPKGKNLAEKITFCIAFNTADKGVLRKISKKLNPGVSNNTASLNPQ